MIANDTSTAVTMEPYQLKVHIKDLKKALKLANGDDIRICNYESGQVEISTNAMIRRDYS